MNATELVQRLVAVGAQRVEPPEGSTAAALLGGVEVIASDCSSERQLRRAWRTRSGGGGTPLLAFGDDPGKPGCVLAIGIPAFDSPMRSVDTHTFSGVLESLVGKQRLHVVRTIASELDRLDQAGLPGLMARGLLTVHTLDGRLRNDTTRWQGAINATALIDRSFEWRQTLEKLGWVIEQLPQRGYVARADGHPVLVVHPKATSAEFTRLDDSGRPPEGQLMNDCAKHGARFGLLATGGRMRLFDAHSRDGTATTAYLELDIAALQVDDIGMVAVLSPDYLAGDGFDRLVDEARQFGQNLHARLDTTLRAQALPRLATALGVWAAGEGLDLNDEQVRTELEHASLTLVFRLLFVLYSEGAGHLPVDNLTYSHNSLSGLITEAIDTSDKLSPSSTSLWDRHMVLIKSLRSGNPAWEVPAYNGKLFAADGFEGTGTLERCSLPDPDMAAVLAAIGRDARTGSGLDFSTMEIGHLGHLYESLLSVRLVLADQAVRYRYNERDKQYEIAADGEIEAIAGQLMWQQHEGSRKGGGVYYTRSELVRHLVSQAVLPAFERHLTGVGSVAESDPAAAAELLFDFSVLDPACGSAHFLVEVTNALADRLMRFLAERPLPKVAESLDHLRAGASAGAHIDDAALLRRLVLKRCVYGVDVSPMGTEIAKLSLWLASFVPGLSLAYLDRNVILGNSLVGVARPEAISFTGANGRRSFFDEPVTAAIEKAAQLVGEVARSDDRNPDEVIASEQADDEARHALEGLQRVFDLWTADGFGLQGARNEVEMKVDMLIGGEETTLSTQAAALREHHRFLHWPLEFPTIFSGPTPGFDCVVGNPPWDEITVEEASFWALFKPGIRRGISDSRRREEIAQLEAARPELRSRLDAELARANEMRRYFPNGEYQPMTGDPDLYKYFCQRYQRLLTEGGALGVVLPRTTFVNDGSSGFRSWLFEDNTCDRLDFLKNSSRWAFDIHAQKGFALVAARKQPAASDVAVPIAGIATSMKSWLEQIAEPGVPVVRSAFAAGWTPPMVRSSAEVDLLAKLAVGRRFPFGAGGRWQCFGVAELHETNDRKLWNDAQSGRPFWKGESFGQYDPHGTAARVCPESTAVFAKVTKPRPGAGSLLASLVPISNRRSAVADQLDGARIAFRDVTQNNNSRTVIAALVPPKVFLGNSAPYLSFVQGAERERALCLGVMNSLPFDWQARRFAEVHLNFFILELLTVPDLADGTADAVATAAARLSCVDERFSAFAEACGVDVGPLADEEHLHLTAEIDAQVAHAWGLTQADLAIMFEDFTTDAVNPEHRVAVSRRLDELSDAT